MLPGKYQWIAIEFEPEGDPWALLQIASALEGEGNAAGAATALDRAFGIDPDNEKVRAARSRVLDSLAVTEHGVVWRYVPAGTFLMGSLDGDPDEQPRHPVCLDAYWIAQEPTTLESYRRWSAGHAEDLDDFSRFFGERLRMGYSEGGRMGGEEQEPEDGQPRAAVDVGWEEAKGIAARLKTPGARFGLPTEAQWEKAARGGLIGARYPWGDEPPAGRGDCGNFWSFGLQPVRQFPPNGYGLYAMSGGVWEWTADWYDARFYAESPDANPTGPAKGKQLVARGGSWADCAEAATASFRMSSGEGRRHSSAVELRNSPNVGFRLCRVAG